MLNHKGTIPLETDRLLLRPFRPTDGPAMFRNWASDPEVAKYLTWRAHSTLKVTEDVLDSWCNHYTARTYKWAITLKPDFFPEAAADEAVGSIDIVRLCEEEDGGNFGWAISRKYWGQGVTTEAARALCRYLFGEVGFLRLRGLHHVDNYASGGVMKKVGMSYCRDLLGGGCNDHDGNPCPVSEYLLTREKFEATALRPAYQEEVPAVARLYAAVSAPDANGGRYAGWRSGVYPTASVAEEAFAAGALHVAVRSGKLAGTVILNTNQPDAYAALHWGYPADRVLVVHTLAVAPGQCGGGLGRALLGYAERIAREMGMSVLRLDTYEKNLPAQRLYESCGYRGVGLVDLGYGESDGLWNFFVYEKQL